MDNGRFLSPKAFALICYFELFPAKSILAGDAAKYMTSEGISVRILIAHKDFLRKFVLCNISLQTASDVFLRELLNSVFTKTSFLFLIFWLRL